VIQTSVGFPIECQFYTGCAISRLPGSFSPARPQNGARGSRLASCAEGFAI
jgi:hypothetical protein